MSSMNSRAHDGFGLMRPVFLLITVFAGQVAVVAHKEHEAAMCGLLFAFADGGRRLTPGTWPARSPVEGWYVAALSQKVYIFWG